MPIYTKTGDSGQTSLLSGQRVSKDCISLQVVGALDELNAVLGIVLARLMDSLDQNEVRDLVGWLVHVQKDLFKIGAEIASIQMTIQIGSISLIEMSQIEQMEKEIDKMWEQLPSLQNFILPGGSKTGAFLHLARTVCRRTERELVSLGRQEKIRPELFMYLNRLSDFLFAAARWVNWKFEKKEELVK